MLFLRIGLALTAVLLIILFICFSMAYYVPKKSKHSNEEFPIPDGEVYAPFREAMVNWIKEVRAMPREAVSVTSFDGLTLRGYYYEYTPGAPIELMFPGYRGQAERDLCGGVQRCFALGHSALIVDQRACGISDGNVISFGVNESRDCLTWLDYMQQRFGSDTKIILTGISMGAATVLLAAGGKLPDNVIGVLADCGYSSAKDIICKVIRDMKLPVKAAYPFVRLAGKLFGGFDIEDADPAAVLPACKVPVILFHGEADDFVPCDMSRINYDQVKSRKKLVTIPNAAHGLSYPVDPDGYISALKEFWQY